MKFSIGSQVWIYSIIDKIPTRFKGMIVDVYDTHYSVVRFDPIDIIEFPFEPNPDRTDFSWLEER